MEELPEALDAAQRETDLISTIREFKLSDPDIGVKPIVAKLRERHPEAECGAKEVRELLQKLAAQQTEEVEEAVVEKPEAVDAEPNCEPVLMCSKCGESMMAEVATCSLCLKNGWGVVDIDDPFTLKGRPLIRPKYCSEKCKRRHMREHQQWHREISMSFEHEIDAQLRLGLEAREKMIGDITDEYDLLNAKAIDLSGKGEGKRAVKLLEKAIKQMPWEPEAYFNLGTTQMYLFELVKAMQAFQSAFDWHYEGTVGWAQSAVMVHQCIKSMRRRKIAFEPPAWHADPEECARVADIAIRFIEAGDDGAHQIKQDALSRIKEALRSKKLLK